MASRTFVTTYAEPTALVAATGLRDTGTYVTYGRAAEEDGGFGLWRFALGAATIADGGTVLADDAVTGALYPAIWRRRLCALVRVGQQYSDFNRACGWLLS